MLSECQYQTEALRARSRKPSKDPYTTKMSCLIFTFRESGDNIIFIEFSGSKQ